MYNIYEMIFCWHWQCKGKVPLHELMMCLKLYFIASDTLVNIQNWQVIILELLSNSLTLIYVQLLFGRDHSTSTAFVHISFETPLLPCLYNTHTPVCERPSLQNCP